MDEAWREDHRTDEGVAAEARRRRVRRRVRVAVVLGVVGGLVWGGLYLVDSVLGSGRFAPTGAERGADATAQEISRSTARHIPRHGDRPVAEVIALGDAASDPGDEPGARVELLGVTGTAWGGSAVVRVRFVYAPQGFTFTESSRTTRCYRITLQRYGYDQDGSPPAPERVDCPDAAPMALPTPSPEPTLPADVDARIRAALKGLGGAERHDPHAVYEAVHGRVGPGVTTTAVADDGSVGVAVSTGPWLDCVAARVLPDGRYETWHPPRVVVQPGELGCSAGAFAAGFGKTPPH